MAEFGEQVLYGQAFAENDLSGSQYFFVELSGDDRIDAIDDDNDFALGVLQNKPLATEEATVCLSGVSKMRAGAVTITAGNRIGADGNGRATTTVNSGGSYRGIALTGTTSGALFKAWIWGALDTREV